MQSQEYLFFWLGKLKSELLSLVIQRALINAFSLKPSSSLWFLLFAWLPVRKQTEIRSSSSRSLRRVSLPGESQWRTASTTSLSVRSNLPYASQIGPSCSMAPRLHSAHLVGSGVKSPILVPGQSLPEPCTQASFATNHSLSKNGVKTVRDCLILPCFFVDELHKWSQGLLLLVPCTIL